MQRVLIVEPETATINAQLEVPRSRRHIVAAEHAVADLAVEAGKRHLLAADHEDVVAPKKNFRERG